MEFDESKVFTALTADKAKPGYVGFFSDTCNGLKQEVYRGHNLQELIHICDEECVCRFKTKKEAYTLFYFVAEHMNIKFDKSKVMHLANAEDAEIGSKGYFADDMHTLELLVTGNLAPINTLSRLNVSNCTYRFVDQYNEPHILFYPIEEVKNDTE